MKALTVQQPWAWAIVWGGKDIENRTWVPRHRGRLLIHAGKTVDREAEPFVEQFARTGAFHRAWSDTGALIGAVDVVGWHQDSDACCRPWGATEQIHIELANPKAFAEPIPCRGALGLWVPPADLTDTIAAAIWSAADTGGA